MPKKLEPGEHSDLADNKMSQLENGSWQMWWTVRLHDGRKVRRPSQGPTKSEVRRRARVAIAELLATSGSSWKTSAKLTDYITEVTMPAIENARLSENSKRQYRRGVAMLIGACEQHRHNDSLKGHSIASGTKFRALERCLKEVARLHGHESAHQSRSVLSRYLMQELLRDELIPGDPIRGVSLDFGAKPERSRGGRALTVLQRRQVIDYLLELDPSDGLKVKQQGRWSLEHRTAKRESAIDLTLLQATTGVRVSEANALTVDGHLLEAGERLVINITGDIAKNSVARRVPLLLDPDGAVAERLRRRRSATPPGGFLIGAPADRTKMWESGNCNKETAKLYKEMGEVLGIAAFEKERTHIWRTTLNSLLESQVSEGRRAALFGHDAEINRQHYTDLDDISQLVEAGG